MNTPLHVYHFTSSALWKLVESYGSLIPLPDGDTRVSGIYAVDKDNFSEFWYDTKYLELLATHLHKKAFKSNNEQTSILAVKIELNVIPEDLIYFRNVEDVFKALKTKRGYLNVIKFFSSKTRRLYEQTISGQPLDKYPTSKCEYPIEFVIKRTLYTKYLTVVADIQISRADPMLPQSLVNMLH